MVTNVEALPPEARYSPSRIADYLEGNSWETVFSDIVLNDLPESSDPTDIDLKELVQNGQLEEAVETSLLGYFGLTTGASWYELHAINLYLDSTKMRQVGPTGFIRFKLVQMAIDRVLIDRNFHG